VASICATLELAHDGDRPDLGSNGSSAKGQLEPTLEAEFVWAEARQSRTVSVKFGPISVGRSFCGAQVALPPKRPLVVPHVDEPMIGDGDPMPSPDDMTLTRRLVDAGRLIGVDVLDHIVIGEGRYASFRERGWL